MNLLNEFHSTYLSRQLNYESMKARLAFWSPAEQQHNIWYFLIVTVKCLRFVEELFQIPSHLSINAACATQLSLSYDV